MIDKYGLINDAIAQASISGIFLDITGYRIIILMLQTRTFQKYSSRIILGPFYICPRSRALSFLAKGTRYPVIARLR